MVNTTGTRIGEYPIGASCHWRTISPAEMSDIARTLEIAKTRPWMRDRLARRAASAAPTGEKFSPITPVTTTGEKLSSVGEQLVTFGGHEVDAPGFTQGQFERAMARALIDELEIHAVNGYHVVCHKGLTGGYKVTRTSCTCKAGAVGTPCKHRAALCFHLDVRVPAVRKLWQETERIAEQRRAGKAVA